MSTGKKVLIVLKHPGYIWQYGYANVIERLVEDDCEVVVAFTNTKKQDWLHQTDLVRSLSPEKAAKVSIAEAPVREDSAHVKTLRAFADYQRYASPTFLGAETLRWRARSFTPARWLDGEDGGTGPGRCASGFWQWLERSIPADRQIARFLRECRPDVVVLSQLVEFVSDQRDYVDACNRLGIPCVYMVASWDNLTNKGAVAVRPDKVLVWNEIQKQEAVALHGLPEESVCVCGAVPFEDLRERKVAVDRQAQLQSLGLGADDEYIVFLGSSNFISEFGEETAYFQSFAAAMAKHPNPRIARMRAVIRPHPQSAAAWAKIDLRKIGANCVLSGNLPQSETGAHDPGASRQEFYDLLYHASAAFGANTTAMIEASIVGTPVASLETLRGQRETIHYYYLRTGVLASSVPADLLDELLTVFDGGKLPRMCTFPEKFAFPRGSERPSNLVAEAILAAAEGRSRSARQGGLAYRAVGRLAVALMRKALARDWQGVLDARLRVKYQASEQLSFQRLVIGHAPVVFGLTAYNNAPYLKEALDSLLAQSYRNFAIVCVDDCSTDGTAEILRKFEKADPRVRVFRNDERLGMVATWRKAFELAMAVAPNARYFAWASDHDIWDQQWLERMLLAASENDDAVLIYPQTVMIDGKGVVLKKPVRPVIFDTENTTTTVDRLEYTARHLKGAGNMVYGLFRADALRHAGVFRDVLLPDRLLMLDMASQGRLLQVDAILWKRRVISNPSLERQYRTLFTEENRPKYLWASWALQHAVAFGLRQLKVLRATSGLSIPEVLRLSLLVYVTQRKVEREKVQAGKLNSLWTAWQARITAVSSGMQEHTAIRALSAVRHGLRDWGRNLAAVLAGRRGRRRPGEVLFVGRRYMHMAYFNSLLEQILQQDKPLKILFDQEWSAKDPVVARDKFERFISQNPRARFGWARRRPDGPLRRLLFSARELRAYLSYDARNGVSDFYVERWWALLTASMKARFDSPMFKRLAKTWAFRKCLSLLERLSPPDPDIVRELLADRPALLIVSPLIQRFSEEVEYLKAARFLGIPTAALVLSWDTLSTKGLIHVQPDHLLVWNEHHRRQAERIHGVPRRRIHVVGAPFFDRWFESRPPVDPAAVRAKWKIPTDQYVLYLGSSANIARDESWFVQVLADAMAERQEFAGVSLVVRPHPANRAVFEKIDRPNVVLTAMDGTLPDTDREHHAFAALMKSAVCCIGINTSAMLDSVFAGAPVATVLLDEYAGTQKKAEHFAILAEAGCLEVFDDAPAFLDWATGLRPGDDRYAERYERFAQDFARPAGREISAAEASVRELGLLAERSEPSIAGSQDLPVCQVDPRRRVGMSETRFGASLIAHLDRRLNSEVYESYSWARAAVLRMLDDEEAKLPEVSDYWRAELDGFQYMLDASPLVVDKMREHCYHITGIKSYDYRDHHSHKAEPYLRKLDQLRKVDPVGLFVPEALALGGFGYRTPDGDLINIDTLKFYEVMIGLHQSGFADGVGLSKAGGGAKPPVVMEIGSGWGGFAYHFRSIYPNAVYVCLDLPQTMIFSLTYLKCLFPERRFLIVDSDETAEELQNYRDYDFIFVPHQRVDDLRRLRLDGCINMVSFQEMTSENVESYARFLHEIGCKHIYSLNRDRSAHNSNLTSVSEILGKYYELTERDVLTLPYTNLGALPETPKAKGIHDYRHQIGIRKDRA